MSRLDQLYRRLLLTKFFTKGWGKPDNLKRLFDFRKIISNRELCRQLVPSDYPIHIEKEYPDGDCRILEGHLISPLTHHLPGIMPKEVEKASFQMILPVQWKHSKLKPICIHLAGTGDHFFWRRRILMAKPLLKDSGIASIILENPFYGSRKPKGQLRSSLHNVSDLFVMGGALILESLALFHWCQRQGYGPLGITGISMGGHMASLAATNWHEPLSLIPCLSWSTASAVFTQGVMSGAIPWKTLETQFFENSVYQDEISQLLISPEEHHSGHAYSMGQQFVKDFSHNFDNLQQMHESYLQTHPDQTFGNVSGQTLAGSPTILSNSLGLTQAGGSVADLMQTPFSSVSSPNVLSEPRSSQTLQPEGKGESLAAQSRAGSQAPPSPPLSDSLTLQHALSKSKLSRTATQTPPAAQNLDVPLQHAMSKSKLSKTQVSNSDPSKGPLSLTLQQEAVNFMVGVMDECTHLGNFSQPVDPRLIIIVAATQDAYVPRQGVMPLDKLWPGSEVRYLTNRGHVAAFLLNNDVFRQAIVDSFNRQIQLHHQN